MSSRTFLARLLAGLGLSVSIITAVAHLAIFVPAIILRPDSHEADDALLGLVLAAPLFAVGLLAVALVVALRSDRAGRRALAAWGVVALLATYLGETVLFGSGSARLVVGVAAGLLALLAAAVWPGRRQRDRAEPPRIERHPGDRTGPTGDL